MPKQTEKATSMSRHSVSYSIPLKNWGIVIVEGCEKGRV
jgi:hypothetical protein